MKIPIWTLLGATLVSGFAGCDSRKQEPARVGLDSRPTGALLVLNGNDVGKGPYFFEQPTPGKYLLHLEKEGYEPLDRILEITQDSPSEIVTQLQPVQGLVLFESIPAGADVTLDGVRKGKTPFFCMDLSVGKYPVTFLLEGYDPRDTAISISNRAPILCQMNMKSKYATLRVTSNPSGAAVILDGIHHGRTPCSVDDVLVATHTLKLVKDGFHDYEEQIKPSQTADFTLSVELKERLASLDISSTPADARVTIDNEFKGRTPLQVKGLRDGKYNLAIEKPSFGRFSRVVEIKNNQDGAVEANLANTEGKLALKVSPPGSNIMVESESRGLSTENPFELDLEPGAYKIQVSKNGYQSQTLKAEVRVGKTTEINVNLRHPWVKDTTLLLKNKRVREGMMISKYPNGGIRIETAPGIFEEFTADEIESNSPIK